MHSVIHSALHSHVHTCFMYAIVLINAHPCIMCSMKTALFFQDSLRSMMLLWQPWQFTSIFLQPIPLFTKIEDSAARNLKERFAGKQNRPSSSKATPTFASTATPTSGSTQNDESKTVLQKQLDEQVLRDCTCFEVYVQQ